VIEHSMVTRSIERAQKKVEARNFEMRKNLLKFDDVMNDQRKVIYEQRKDLMAAEEVHETVVGMRHEVLEDFVAQYIPEKAYAEQWETAALHEEVMRVYGVDAPVAEWAKEEGIADAEILERLISLADRKMAEKAANYGPEVMRMVEKSMLLQLLDQLWKDHLLTLDHLRQGIGLRAYGQRDPLNEYKREAFDLFEVMLGQLRERVTQVLSQVELQITPDEELLFAQARDQEMHMSREDPAFSSSATISSDGEAETLAAVAPVTSRRAASAVDPDDQSTWGRVARNAPCPCQSGKKFKHCHGKVA
ncbi:MAG: SEC-C metal-binding domain-containing protein, partial [Proteobacteria bacterium]|nr:SEC-C metal-binding domain-containing protein [Pseudomonadota bacterium]